MYFYVIEPITIELISEYLFVLDYIWLVTSDYYTCYYVDVIDPYNSMNA